jgi:ankyrin repeat protein
MTNEQIFECAREGNLIKLGQVVARAKVGVTDADGLTPLMHACSAGGLKIVKMLLKEGTDASLTDSNGKTARAHAEAGGHAKCLKRLSKLG